MPKLSRNADFCGGDMDYGLNLRVAKEDTISPANT